MVLVVRQCFPLFVGGWQACDSPNPDVIPSLSCFLPAQQQHQASQKTPDAQNMDILLKPTRVATSKPAQRTYLNTLLLLITSFILLGVAIVAYLLFYFNYIPQIGVERVIHLQYGDGPNPYGITKLDSSLISQQPYDITLSLHLPRSPTNLQQGNFMLSLSLLRPTYTPPPPSSRRNIISKTTILAQSGPVADIKKEEIILSTRRPAILTYTSRLISLGDRFLSLPLYLVGWRKESERMQIPMAELTAFSRGANNVPGYAVLEVEAGQKVQVYDVKLYFTARFGGLRWWMYNHRIISFFVMVSAFWGAEIVFTVIGWITIRSYFSGGSDEEMKQQERFKIEDTEGETSVDFRTELDEPDLSDTERTFPTYGKQTPLKFEGRVKVEEGEKEGMEGVLDETTIQPLEADDEDDEVGWGDSGLGTSYSEAGASTGRGSARRRSRGGRGGRGGYL